MIAARARRPARGPGPSGTRSLAGTGMPSRLICPWSSLDTHANNSRHRGHEGPRPTLLARLRSSRPTGDASLWIHGLGEHCSGAAHLSQLAPEPRPRSGLTARGRSATRSADRRTMQPSGAGLQVRGVSAAAASPYALAHRSRNSSCVRACTPGADLFHDVGGEHAADLSGALQGEAGHCRAARKPDRKASPTPVGSTASTPGTRRHHDRLLACALDPRHRRRRG